MCSVCCTHGATRVMANTWEEPREMRILFEAQKELGGDLTKHIIKATRAKSKSTIDTPQPVPTTLLIPFFLLFIASAVLCVLWPSESSTRWNIDFNLAVEIWQGVLFHWDRRNDDKFNDYYNIIFGAREPRWELAAARWSEPKKAKKVNQRNKNLCRKTNMLLDTFLWLFIRVIFRSYWGPGPRCAYRALNSFE